MGYDLINEKKEYMYFTLNAFPDYLEAAYECGWEPMGTVLPEWRAEYQAGCVSGLWWYEFTFSVEEEFAGVTHSLYSEKELTDQDIEYVKRNPDSKLGLKDRESTHYKHPYECVKVNIYPPCAENVQTPEDIQNEWCGSYVGNAFQTIVAEDVLNLAKALRQAAADLKYAHLHNLEELADFFSQGAVTIS